MIISCKDYFNERIKELAKNNYLGEFHIIQINDEADSNTYVKNKIKDCEKIGLNVILHKFVISENLIDPKSIEFLIRSLNENKNVIGIMIQLPIYEELRYLLNLISPKKDVDNLNHYLPGNFYSCCTPKGIIDYLKRNEIDLDGKDVTIVGRSDIVGKPLAEMMTKENATVTLCHSHTKNLIKHTKNADIVVCAIGKEKFFTEEYFSPNQLVIDVGINFWNGKLCGDVDEDRANQVEGIKITSVPGGVGLLTRLALLENCAEASKRNFNAEENNKYVF